MKHFAHTGSRICTISRGVDGGACQNGVGAAWTACLYLDASCLQQTVTSTARLPDLARKPAMEAGFGRNQSVSFRN